MIPAINRNNAVKEGKGRKEEPTTPDNPPPRVPHGPHPSRGSRDICHVSSNLNVTTGIVTSPPSYAARSPSGQLPSPWSLPRLPRRLLLLVSYLASRVVSRFTLRLSRRLLRPSRLSLHASSPASSLASLASSLASLASSLTSLASSPAVSRRCSFSRRSRWCSSSRRDSVSGLGGVQCAFARQLLPPRLEKHKAKIKIVLETKFSVLRTMRS